MAGGIRLEFAQFGSFDSFSIYRSSSSMNASAMPAPIATGIKTMYFEDTSVVVGSTYYYRVGVLRGSNTLISDEVVIEVKDVAGISFKFWRLKNIRVITDQIYRDPAEIVFYNKQGASLIENKDKGFAKNFLEGGDPYNAFDANPNTLAHIGAVLSDNEARYWYIGYEFSKPVNIASVGVQPRQDLVSAGGYGREFQTADVEVSNDGVNWVLYGTIKPHTPPGSGDMVISPINVIDRISGGIPTDYILCYDFNNNLLDKSKNLLNGVKTGTTVFDTGRKTGTKCIRFTNGLVKTPAVLPIDTDEVTISFWFKKTQTSVGILYELSENSNAYHNVFSGYFNDVVQGAFQSTANNGIGVFNIVTAPVKSTGVWQHVVSVIEKKADQSNENRMYINNVLSSINHPDHRNDVAGVFGSHVLHIGARGGLVAPYVGSIQDFKVYNRALSQAEITALYNE